ncbi:hypothetical protein ACVBEQ_19705 [Nakamurella sp. GG22]
MDGGPATDATPVAASDLRGPRPLGIATGLTVLAGLLFLVAGGLSIMAARLRWGPACSDGFDNGPCVLLQDHRYDYLLPTQPWDPIPGAAELAGASYIVIGFAIALVFAAVRSVIWVRMLQALLVLSVLLLGVTTFLSGRAGVPIEPATAVASWLMPLWMVAAPMALVVMFTRWAVGPEDGGLLPALAWALWAGLLVLATPLPEYFIVSLAVGYTSHDTTPWTGAASGVMVALAGIVVLAGVAWNSAQRRRLSGAGGSSATASPG